MFNDEILSSLEINFIQYPSERNMYSKEYIYSEDIGFDKVMSTMKSSQKKIDSFSQMPYQCFNYNCKLAFSNAKSVCWTCEKIFCHLCITSCDVCSNIICTMCSRINYSDKDRVTCCYCN